MVEKTVQRILQTALLGVLLAQAISAQSYPEKIHPALSNAHGNQNIDVIVEYDEHSTLAFARLESHGCSPKTALGLIHGIAASCPASALETISAEDDVYYIWDDEILYPLLDQSVPLINGTLAGQAFGNATGINVSVIDTGINVSHPWLADAIILEKDFTPEGILDDRCNHGTAAACVVGCRNDTYGGVAQGANIFNAKAGRVLNHNPLQCGAAASDVIAAMDWSVQSRAQVIIINFGGFVSPCYSSITANAVNRTGKNVTIVVGAGNNGPGNGSIASPGCAENALAVGASNGNAIESYSARGPTDYGVMKPETVAPGTAITAAHNSGIGTSDYTGTSFAGPHVAGVVALMQKHKRLRPSEVRLILNTTSFDLGYEQHEQGAGRVDAYAAVAAAVALQDTFILNVSELFKNSTNETTAQVVAELRNEGNQQVNATSLRLIVPEGVTLLDTDTALTGDIPGLEQRKASWHAQANASGNYTIIVVANASNADNANRSATVELFAEDTVTLSAVAEAPATSNVAQPFVVNATITAQGGDAAIVNATLTAPADLVILNDATQTATIIAEDSSVTLNWTVNASRSGNYTANVSVAASNAEGVSTATNISVAVTAFTFFAQQDSASGVDAYLRSNNPTLNYGASPLMRIDSGNPHYRPLVFLNLSAIPAFAAITSATYTLFMESAMNTNAQNVTIYRVTRSWTEGTGNGVNPQNGTTWQTYNGTAPWTTAGGDYNSSAWSSLSVSSTNKNYTWHITNLARAWHDGTYPNNGFIMLTTGGIRKDFSSSDSSVASRRPRLQINYTL